MNEPFLLIYNTAVIDPPAMVKKPRVNMINLHTVMWGVMKICGDESTTKKNKTIFETAMNSLDEYITPMMVYNMFSECLPYYDMDIDMATMLKYANNINKLNTEITKSYNAKCNAKY